MLYNIALISYVIFYTLIALGIRSFILYLNTGINPFKKMGKGGVQGINEKVLMVGAALVPIIAFTYVFFKNWYHYLVPIDYLEIDSIRLMGVFLMIMGSVVTIVAQFQMGNSWRIGINPTEKTTLIQTGLFRYSRNPIYFSLLISFLGFFLVVPNALSLCALGLSYPSVEIKIRLEEQYLIEKHGTEFIQYMEKVKRWI